MCVGVEVVRIGVDLKGASMQEWRLRCGLWSCYTLLSVARLCEASCHVCQSHGGKYAGSVVRASRPLARARLRLAHYLLSIYKKTPPSSPPSFP